MIKLAIAPVLAASLAASLATLAAPAAAQATSSVAYADLDIASPAGAKAFDGRLEARLDAVCARPDVRDIRGNIAFTACKDASRSEALSQLADLGAPVARVQVLTAN